MERNLRNVSAEYEKVFQGTQNAMFLVEVVNPNTFRYIRTNQAYEKLTGISAENIRGKTPQGLVGKSIGNHVALNYSKCLQSASPISYKETRDGKIKFISESSVKIKWEGYSAILAIMTDITELK